MEEEHDILDWGGEDDESKNQDASRNGALDARRTEGDNDDVEDCVSLGDEEEEQEFYSYQQEDSNVAAVEAESSNADVAPPSTDADDEPSTSRSLQREDSSTSQILSSNAVTPRRNSSAGRRSPQRALQPRITHALPPKPVVTNVPFLHPSHPSIVEATAMSVATRTTGRSESSKTKVNGTSSTTISATGNGNAPTTADELEPLPRGWEAREARSGQGGTYYYNVRTQQSTWTRPSQDLSHFSRRQPIELEHMTDAPTPVPDLNGMTYNDRHYRPGGADGPTAPTSTNDRHHREDVDPRFNPRPDQAFTPSPDTSPRVRERERSPSPLPMLPSTTSRGRDSRSSRAPQSSRGGRQGNTDADSSTRRDRDIIPNSYPTRDNWDQSNVYQESRHHSRHQYEMPFDPSSNESRPFMPPRSARGRRDRDQSTREESRIQNMPDSRTRSPPPKKRDVRTRHIDGSRDRDYDSNRTMPPSRGQEGYPASINGTAPTQFSIHPLPQHRRERPTRFGQSTSPMVPSSQLSVRPPAVEPQIYPHRPLEEDDPFVPDDIRSPPPHDQQRREALEKIQAVIQASENGSLSIPRHPSRRPRQSDGRDKSENAQFPPIARDRSPPSSEQHPRRARPPLPPQSAEFQGIASRPREPHHLPRHPQDRPDRHPNSNERDEPPSGGPRERGPGNPPNGPRLTGYGQDRATRDVDFGDLDSVEAEMVQRRTAEIAHYPPNIQAQIKQDMKHDIKMRRMFRSAEEEEIQKLERGAHRRGSFDMGPPVDLRRGEIDSHSEQMYPPRGPRAMSSGANTSATTQNGPISPVIPTTLGPGPSARNPERSPPPHLGGRAKAAHEWRDDRGAFNMSERGGRQDRGRHNDFARPPPASASGTNNVPIGNQRKPIGNSGPSGQPMRMLNGPPAPGMGGMNQRPTKGGTGMRGRGGASSHPPRDLQYERTYGGEQPDRFRTGRLESDGAPPRRRDSSLPPFERHQPLSVDTAVSREHEHFSTSPLDPRHESTSTDPTRLAARTWTPRGEPPPEVFVGTAGASSDDHRHPSSPPHSKESPHRSPLLTKRLISSSRDSMMRGRILGFGGGPPPQGQRRVADEPRGSALEGRLPTRFSDESRQTHALPQNPTLLQPQTGADALKLHSTDINVRTEARRANQHYFDNKITQRKAEEEERRLQEPEPYSSSHGSRDIQDQEPYGSDIEMDGPPRLRSQAGRDEYMERKRRLDNRPELPRRPGSLLERLEMSVDETDTQEGPSFSRSLSDRVEVPSKRLRDQYEGDVWHMGGELLVGDDDADLASKRVRRKTMRPRKLKRA
ncbi:hypothetical protein DXG01_001844 [Tephrocybe rancida]|nr:hypothetical protein DXG01_001844 [Tephrocybe rancida]